MDLNTFSKGYLVDLLRVLENEEEALEGNKLNTYKPHAGQLAFHKSDATIRMVITGNRWGKTTASVIETAYLALGVHPFHKIPVPNRGKLYGETYATVDETIRLKFDEWVPRRFLSPRRPYLYNNQGNLVGINFANGSMVKIGSYDQEEKKAEGSNWHYVAFDEPPTRQLYIANLRGLVDFGGKMWFTMTPLSAAWIFDDLWSPGVDRTKSYIECFAGISTDNIYLDKQRFNEFLNELTDAEKEVRLYGRFAQLQGLVIHTYDSSFDVDPFELDSSFTLYEGIDPHPTKPHAALWKAINQENQRFVVAELKCDQGMRVFGQQIAEIRRNLTRSGALLYRSVCDTSLNQTDPNFRLNLRDELNNSLLECGERILPANAQKKDWLEPGITKLIDLYRPVLNPLTNEKVPTERVFKSCTNYKYELKHYQYPKVVLLENTKPVAKDNDLIDCNRYIESVAPTFQTPGQSAISYYSGGYKKKNVYERWRP